MLYEIVNPSDTVTFYAKDHTIAHAVILILGEGKYGCKCLEDARFKATLFIFMNEKDTERELQRIFGPDGMGAFLKSNCEDIARSLNTCAVTTFLGLKEFDERFSCALANGLDEQFKNDWNEKHRTSMNNICSLAHQYAKQVIEMGKEKKA